MRGFFWVLLVMLCSWAATGRAADLVAIRPGVMCVSKAALARLTLPGGDSRTHRPDVGEADLAMAASGGCVDLPPGFRITVEQMFRNTVIARVGGVTYTAPSIDFAPVGGAMAGAVAPPAMRVATRLAVGDGDTLVLLEDRRLDAAMQQRIWGSSEDPSTRLDPDQLAELAKQPLLAAHLELRSASEVVRSSRTLASPAATLRPAKLHGLPNQAFLVTVDLGVGMGSYAGPTTTIIEPGAFGLLPVSFTDAHGHSGPIVLADTLKRGWRIVPSRTGGTEEIERVTSDLGDGGQWTTTTQAFRYQEGRWRLSERVSPGQWENEDFPPRSDFP